MNSARAAAIVTWAYAAGFGASALPVAVCLQSNGKLPSFFGLFDMFAGPWFEHLPRERFLRLLLVFPAVTALASASGLELWKGRRRGGALNSPCFRLRQCSGPVSPSRSRWLSGWCASRW